PEGDEGTGRDARVTAWPVVRLDEVFEVSRGGSPRPIASFITDDPGGINWITIADASEGTKFITQTKRRIRPEGAERSRSVKPGDFLLTNSMSFGRPYIMATSGCVHDGWLVLSPRRAGLAPDFFYHLLGSASIYREFERRAAGVTVKNLNIELVKDLPVPLPPVHEQRRIAAILDKANALRAKRRAALAQLDALTQSIFLEIFGDPALNTHGWPLMEFAGVCELRLGKMLDKARQSGAHRRRYLRNANVQWFRFDLASLFEMDFDEEDRQVFALRHGDLLICEGGEPGRAAVWQSEVEECYFQKALHRARPNAAIATSEYVAHLLWFLAKRGRLRDHVTSATIAHLTGEKLAAMKIPIPPVSLQERFDRELATLRRHQSAHDRSLAQLDALFASLQHRAFNGTLAGS
ncbi:MAG: restriction endonuclease subunit S, partial [Acidobacteriota bacterium]|nr:restriction endonuclease subunit S [Acidobacteriota bacterium]